MYRVLTCLVTEHDLRLVVLAGAICLFASAVAISLFHRARASHGRTRAIWICLDATVGGCGIWATHFVAMLAYDPGAGAGYSGMRFGRVRRSHRMTCSRVTISAANIEVRMPSDSVTAKPLIGPEPNWNSRMPAINVVRLASMIVAIARWNPASITAASAIRSKASR